MNRLRVITPDEDVGEDRGNDPDYDRGERVYQTSLRRKINRRLSPGAETLPRHPFAPPE